MSPVPSRSIRPLLVGAGLVAALAWAPGAALAEVGGGDISSVEPAVQQATVDQPFSVTVRGSSDTPDGPTGPHTTVVVIANPVDVACTGYARHNASSVGGGGSDWYDRSAVEAGIEVPVTVHAPGEIRLCVYAGIGGYSTMATLSPIQPTLQVLPAPGAPVTTPAPTPGVPATPKPRGTCTVTPRAVRAARVVVRCHGVSGRVDLRVRRAGRTKHVWRTLQAGSLRASPAKLGLRRGTTARISVFQDGARLGFATVARR